MKNTELINYAEKMARALRGNTSYEPYHNNEIALVLEELRKNLLSQHEENNNLLKAYLND